MSRLIDMSRLIELSHGNPGSLPDFGEWLAGMVLQSVGPTLHEVNVPFHDSQAKGKAILIQTGWDSRWETEAYWEPGPVLTETTIFRLARAGARLIGVDFGVSGKRTAETRLIVDGKVPIVENLHDLSAVPRWGFKFCAVPVQPPAGSSYPVRAFAELLS
jgi:kynurenine formamidase